MQRSVTTGIADSEPSQILNYSQLLESTSLLKVQLMKMFKLKAELLVAKLLQLSKSAVVNAKILFLV